MEVRDALDRLDRIHEQLTKGEVYRGFRVPAVALVGCVGLLATVGRGPEFGPLWYPLALMATSLPACWLGAATTGGASMWMRWALLAGTLPAVLLAWVSAPRHVRPAAVLTPLALLVGYGLVLGVASDSPGLAILKCAAFGAQSDGRPGHAEWQVSRTAPPDRRGRQRAKDHVSRRSISGSLTKTGASPRFGRLKRVKPSRQRPRHAKGRRFR